MCVNVIRSDLFRLVTKFSYSAKDKFRLLVVCYIFRSIVKIEMFAELPIDLI